MVHGARGHSTASRKSFTVYDRAGCFIMLSARSDAAAAADDGGGGDDDDDDDALGRLRPRRPAAVWLRHMSARALPFCT